MVCIVCGGATRAGLLAWHSICSSCHYEAADLKVTINEQQAHDLVDEADREIALKALRVANFHTIAERLARLVPAGAQSLLDVGCAHGWFLEAAAGRFTVLGIEPDAVVGEKAAERGLPVRYGYFPDALRPGETFDVIVFNDVLEHIPNIRSAVQACHARLKAGGLLVVNLPNSKGFFYRLSKLFARCGFSGPFERMWQKGLPSPHVHYFDEHNLSALMAPGGFDKLESYELPALRAAGLMERLRFVGKVNPVSLYAQYLLIMCAIPVLKLFSSDIVVGVFRKR